MYSASQKKTPIIIRMIERDRQAINRMIQHKRAEFESVIKKGIVSMFNAQDERTQLAEQRSHYLGFLTAKNHKKKKLLNSAAQAIKDGTGSAPMGIGSAANLAVTGASAMGSAMLDAAEMKRQQTAAEEQLRSAQILYYVSSKDYEAIAQQVAHILSYRFQFLLFRLAAGENGYIKLANFFVASMNTYAIARLREHKGLEVKALTDAAIPPSTDALSYREWPQVDLANFKWSLKTGIRRTLELDDDANQILERCGPAVRILLGGYQKHVDPTTQRVVSHQSYTIIGALNHAPVLTHKAAVLTGLETMHRKNEMQDGSMKYPMILLGCNETTADLGVNFATRATGIFLYNHSREALHRLVPNFFSYEANYKPGAEPAATQTVYENNADLVYPEERSECPWTKNREAAGQQRLREIYCADGDSFVQEEVVTTADHHKLKAMEIASNLFDANEAKNDAVKAMKETVRAQIAVNLPNMTVDDQAKQRLKVAMASRYAAFAASELMACVVKSSPLEEKHLQCSIDIIDAAKAALHAARDLPIQEANKRKKILVASKQISQYADVITKRRDFYQENFQIVFNVVQESKNFEQMKAFISTEKIAQSSTIRFLRNQMKEDIAISSKLNDFAANIVHHEQNIPTDLQREEVLNALYAAADGVREALDNTGATNDIHTIIQTIELCVSYTQKNYNMIIMSLDVDDYWVENASMSAQQRQEIKENALAAQTQVKNCLREATLKVTAGRLPLLINFSVKNDLIAIKTRAIEAKNASISLLKSIQLYNNDALDSEMNAHVSAYLERLAAATELDILSFLASQKGEIASDAESLLQQRLIDLQIQIKRLESLVKINNAQLAANAHDQLLREANRLMDNMSLTETMEQVRNVRRILGEVENTVINDFEIEDLAISRAQQAVTEVNLVRQEIKDIETKLSSLEDLCLIGREENECVSMFDNSVEQLTRLAMAFNPAKVDAEEIAPQETNPYGEIIKQALSQLMTNVINNAPHAMLKKEEIEAIILIKINEIQQEISTNVNPDLVNNWGSCLVIVTAKWLAQTVQEREKQVPCPIDEAMKAIKQVTEQEPLDLKLAKSAAIASIKQACQDVYDARNGLLRNSKKTEVQEWSLVLSILSWAGRLTVAEFKWEQEQAEQRRIQRRQEFMSIQSRLVSSPFQRGYFIVLDYGNTKLMEKKKLVGDLNKLHGLLKQCQRKLYELEQNQQIRSSVGQLKSVHQVLVQLVDIKLVEVALEQNDLETLRKSVLAQGLRIFFNELKRNLHDPNAQPAKLKSLSAAESELEPESERNRLFNQQAKAVTKQRTEQKMNLSNKKESKLKESKLKNPKLIEEASNITIDDLEIRIKKLEEDLAELPSTKVVSSTLKKSSTFSSSSFFKPNIVGIELNIADSEESRTSSLESSHSGDALRKRDSSLLFTGSKTKTFSASQGALYSLNHSS